MKKLRNPRASGRRRGLVSLLAALAVAGSALIAPTAAAAAGPVSLAVPGGAATVTTSVNFVSGTDLTTPISELKANYAAPVGERRYALRIGYGCGAAASCDAASVTIDPQPLDSIYGTQRFASYDSSTLPAGATIAGTPEAGYVVSLGNLATGASGSFTVLYEFQDRRNSQPAAQSFFLDGTVITNTVTIDAVNAGATATASDSVVWRIDTSAPLVKIDPTTLARADTDYDYVVRMATDCMWYTTANYGEPSKLCAADYTNTLTLPAGVTFVSASPDGGYDSATNTVNWSQSGQAAAQGWGSVNNNGTPRTVTVRFPTSMFTAACTIDATATFETDVTYLDGQTKQASTSTTHQATNCAPFASATPVVKTNTYQQAPNIVYDNGTQNYFNIRVGNKSNVAGVAIIRDENLDIPNLRVFRVTAPDGGTIDYVLDDGTTGTATGVYDAPAGKRFESFVVTSPEIAGPNQDIDSQPLTTYYNVNVRFSSEGSAPADGWERSNTATAVMTYSETGLPDVDEGSSTATVVIAPRPATFTATITRTIPGGGNPTAGQPVDYVVGGRTADVPAGTPIEPQYVFVAPYQWNIVADSWSLATGAPAGAIFETKTVTIAGQAREALYVHWPAGTSWGANATWPNLSVQATPSTSAPAGSSGVASEFTSDATHSFPGLAALWNASRFTDAPDLDGDGSTDEYFATTNAPVVTVGAASSLSTVKEICQVNPDAADGCDWIADTSQAVPVSPVATDLRYRVTLTNNGNASLSNVVAYDVLPYPGDTGVSSGSASTSRGSQFAEKVAAASNVSSTLALAYSTSTNPCRSQVYAGGPAGCADTWGTTAADAASIRATVTSGLAPGASASFIYTASVVGSPSAGERACNSIATAATGLVISEPSPVCAAIEAADLEVTAGTPANAQLGRPTVLPFTVANLSGTDAPATVTVAVPTGIRITDLSFGDWTCTAEGDAAPVDGPATLTCTLSAPLTEGDPVAMNIPAVVLADGVAITATVGSDVFDQVPTNNSDAITIDAEPAASAGLTVTKNDGTVALVPDQETTYTITVANQLIGEGVDATRITDTLPADAEFISASDGGVHDVASGTVTWQISSIPAADSAHVTVTMRLADNAAGTSVSNTVTAEAPDPAFPDETLTGAASDVDQVDRIALTKSATMQAPGDPADPQPGDVIRYQFLIANTGGGVLSNVTLDDPKTGLSAITFPDGWPSLPGRLGAGESVTAVATYKLTADDIDNGNTSNTATATASSAGGENATDTSSVDFALPATGGIALLKDANLDVAGTVHAGDQITYTFEVKNTGNVTLHDVSIDDDLAGLSALSYNWPDAPGLLQADGVLTATATYTLSQDDINRGTVTNTASASGLDVGNVAFTASDDADVAIPAVPAVAFKKTGALSGHVDRPVAGDEVDFTFTVENTGNVTESGLAIADHLDGVSEISYGDWPADAGTLAPGESIVGTATYALSQENIDAGRLTNTATLTGVPTRGTGIEEKAAASVELAQAPGLAVSKTAELLDANGDGLANPRERIQYSFALKNTGNVTLTQVTVNDAKVTGTPVTASLAPGQTVEVFAEPYVVTDADAAASSVENSATAIATAPDDSKLTSDPSTTSTEAAALASDRLATTGVELSRALILTAGGLAGAGILLVGFGMIRRRRRQIESD